MLSFFLRRLAQSNIYRPNPYPWATLTDGGPPSFPAAWPAQLCHQGSNSLLPRQVAHRLSKCLGPPLGIFTRPPWPWNDLTFGQNILWVHICTHEFFDGRIITKSWLKLQFKNALFSATREIHGAVRYSNANLILKENVQRKWNSWFWRL